MFKLMLHQIFFLNIKTKERLDDLNRDPYRELCKFNLIELKECGVQNYKMDWNDSKGNGKS